MKSIKLLIVFGSLFLLYNAEITKVYKCAKDLKADLCSAFESKNEVETYYYKGCPKGQKCNYYCSKYVDKELKEGKKCVIDSECKSGLCKNEKCSYIPDGDNCSGYSSSCGPKSYCKDNICTALETEGKLCEKSWNCVLGTICKISGNDNTYKCIKMFSMEDGVKANDQYLCKSGLIDKDGLCITRTTKTEEWDEYVKEYNKRMDKINDDDERKISGINDRRTLDNRNVAKKFIEIDQYYYEKIDKADDKDKDCIRDYFITELNGNRVSVSLISLFLFSVLFMI